MSRRNEFMIRGIGFMLASAILAGGCNSIWPQEYKILLWVISGIFGVTSIVFIAIALYKKGNKEVR